MCYLTVDGFNLTRKIVKTLKCEKFGKINEFFPGFVGFRVCKAEMRKKAGNSKFNLLFSFKSKWIIRFG